VKRAPVSPDEATQRNQVRRTLDVMTGVAMLSCALTGAQAIATSNGGYATIATMLAGFAVLLVVWPRRILADRRIDSAVTVMALADIAVILVSSIVVPSGALTTAILLIPITAAVPYLESKSLRRLMIVAWAVTIATPAGRLLAGPSSTASGDTLGDLWGSAVVSGLVLFLLYQSSEKLKASSREFRRLFSLSSDLAETTEPGVLGDLVACHLAEATGFDDCVLYALATETGRITPFGSHPADRSLSLEPESLSDRPRSDRSFAIACGSSSTSRAARATPRSALVSTVLAAGRCCCFPYSLTLTQSESPS
jgi:hypothetical protein